MEIRRAPLCLAGILFAATACSGTSPGVLILDAGAPTDAVIIPHDAAPPLLDATTPPDGALTGVDGSPPSLDAMTPTDVGVGVDAGASDAGVDAGPSPTTVDAGPDCSTLLSAMFAAPIAPPGDWLGLLLTTGLPSLAPRSDDGGITIDQANVLSCAMYVEPTVLGADAAPASPGFRTAYFASSADAGINAAVVTLEFNVESRVIYQPAVYTGYVGQLAFHSRAGGEYGSHQYSVSLGDPNDAASGLVLRDGVSFPADWIDFSGNAWVNELYDGIMATFAPSIPAVIDCTTSTFTSYITGLARTPNDCLFLPDNGGYSYLGVRPLGFYLLFTAETNQVVTMWEDIAQGFALGCTTPQAALEAMTYSQIYSSGPGFYIGGIATNDVVSNAGGFTFTEANTIFGCNGTAWTPPDVGYGGIQWGTGELTMEYNADSGVNYKVFVQSGYKGRVYAQTSPSDDAGAQYYQIGIGAMEVGALDDAGANVNWTTLSIDWTTQATANPVVTGIANAWYAQSCSAPPDTDCVAQGDCDIVVDDGQGHSTFTLNPTGLLGAGPSCDGYVAPISFVFPQGGSIPEQIYVVNPAGQ